MKKVKAIIAGFGIVGSGVAKVLEERSGALKREHGLEVELVAICEAHGSVVDEKGIDLAQALKLKAAGKLDSHPAWCKEKSISVIKNTQADVLIELTPTNIKDGEPGVSHFKAAFSSGKHVVTSNKGPLALKYWELQEAAQKAGKQLFFEATVCGGMPVFSLVRHCLRLNKINSIKGILNGTTNYILTKMHESNMKFDAALQEAKELGYAEADPTYDIQGIDASAKLVILANALLGQKKTYSDVKRVGIDSITMEAVQLAKQNNFVIKLIGEASEGKLEVAPRLIPIDNPLNVGGTLNALMLETDLAKEVVVIGRGAGQIETASAILNDLIEASSLV